MEKEWINESNTVLVGICKRRTNDYRDYKLLMNLVGNSSEYSIQPDLLKKAATELVKQLQPRKMPDYIVGLAAAGIPITIAVSYETGIPAIIAYKFRLDLPNELSWREPHCVDDNFYLYGLKKRQSVIIIDDEVDSGNTLINAIEVLSCNGIEIVDIGCIVEVVSREGMPSKDRLSKYGFTLKSLLKVELISES